ncbi:MAG: oxygen-independent coproporphyrinogen III oxidase [Spirosomaceae bacterium]|jgi:oxygen-independent coproporphyrinogen-3 oxidase|nr:oxygen-independent coproporphyrinogen III oxidase [Spirosomataceae bacterium]
MNPQLLQKYNVPGPRYTSYPTVPYWDKTPPSVSEWKSLVKDTFQVTNDTQGISLYIHLPFCEQLCTYCGCNTRITVNHQVEQPYLKALLKEWQMYLAIFGSKPHIREIHLGGGTPTFFSPDNLRYLISGILESADIHPNHEFGFEAHPANTTDAHLQTLHELGFRRVSIGVQDFNPVVLNLINRRQTYAQVKHLTEKAREIGYTSINYDLVYGLPQQRLESVKQTIEAVIELRPDRIALYSYAHVPWIKPGQRKFTVEDLPDAAQKLDIYNESRRMFEEAGYEDVGMDHFALPSDELFKAAASQTLHRNFMGYTTTQTRLLVGLGASSISDCWWGYVQNEKTIEKYYERLEANELPFFKGHTLSREDLILRRHILHLMCNFETTWHNPREQCGALYEALERLEELAQDDLVEIMPFHLSITPKGRNFVRNISMAFDARLWANEPHTELFSQTF